jgi:hypothetical protein
MSNGPQTYPGADTTSQWYQDNYPGSAMEVNCGVVHTTEGTDWPSYSGGASAPTMTSKPNFAKKRLDVRQHFPIDRSGRALMNLPGGVQTNTCNVFQVELIGTCDEKTAAAWRRAGRQFIFWPKAPEWALREVAKLMAWLDENHDIPLSSGLTFRAYPSSYGNTDTRMTPSEWRSFKGWCGHQHVPENSHGDPGSFDIERALEVAKEIRGQATTPDSNPEPQPQTKPTVSLSRLQNAARRNPDASGTPVTYRGVARVERALVEEGLLDERYQDGHFGSTTVEAYRKWQHRCGFTGDDANGIPGRTSLEKLGRRHGWRVRS